MGKWKMGKETGGKKMEDPHSLKSNEMASAVFSHNSHLFAIPSRIVKVCLGSRSWMATVLSCLEKSSRANARRRATKEAKRSRWPIFCNSLLTILVRNQPFRGV